MEFTSFQKPLGLLPEDCYFVPNQVMSETMPGTVLLNWNSEQCEQSPYKYLYNDNMCNQISSNQCETMYSCDICHMSFDSLSCLEMLAHNCDRPYEHCESKDLENHIGRQTVAKGIQCKVYQKYISTESGLKNHMGKHNREKTYQCKVCNKTLSTKGSLTRHMSVHTGKKPYQCKVCEKSFSQKNNLTIHKRVHTGEKSYDCNVCKKGFSRKSMLTLHMRVHTGGKKHARVKSVR